MLHIVFSHPEPGRLSAGSVMRFHKASGPTQTGTEAPPETRHRGQITAKIRDTTYVYMDISHQNNWPVGIKMHNMNTSIIVF